MERKLAKAAGSLMEVAAVVIKDQATLDWMSKDLIMDNVGKDGYSKVNVSITFEGNQNEVSAFTFILMNLCELYTDEQGHEVECVVTHPDGKKEE